MNKQTTNAVLLIDPLRFGFNQANTPYNFIQKESELAASAVSELARQELLELASRLREKSVQVILVSDDTGQDTPSSVFSASWLSLHEDSRIVAYPLACDNRKAERRGNILNILVDNHFPIYDIVDISSHENEGKYVHGMESVVFDRINKVVYAAVSPVTDASVVAELAFKFGYYAITFQAESGRGGEGFPLQTNWVLCLSDQYAIVCLDAITQDDEREFVRKVLLDGGKELIEITVEQALNFAGSAMPLEDASGRPLLVISERGYSALTSDQKDVLSKYNEVLEVSIPTIESVGGASVSSIINGIFLPK